MQRARPEEIWAAQMIEAALSAPVTLHDDGSAPSQHDLSIAYSDGTFGAVEVTACADAEMIELWKLLNPPGGRWIDDTINGGWTVQVHLKAKFKRLRQDLPQLVRILESQCITDLRASERSRAPLEQFAHELGVRRMHQADTSFPGSIYVFPEQELERMGGFVPDHGNDLAEWVGEFLREGQQADVLAKLDRSGAQRRHAFIIMPGFSTADFSVTHLLVDEDPPLPTQPPDLPAEVTEVWAVSTWATGTGIRWSPGSEWQKFSKLQPYG